MLKYRRFSTVCAFLVIYILITLITTRRIRKYIYEKNRFYNSLSDIVLVVRTTSKFHSDRVQAIHDTWYQLTNKQLHLITDKYDDRLYKQFNRVNVCYCKSGHTIEGLCCRTACEFEVYINESSRRESVPKWMCRFDDDQYVNVPRLVKLLQSIDPNKPQYIGRFSTPLLHRKIPGSNAYARFRFNTYGAGICFSLPTISLLLPFVQRNVIVHQCKLWNLPDDMYIGKLIYHDLKLASKQIPGFHSHLPSSHYDNIKYIFMSQNLSLLRDQISFGFSDRLIFNNNTNYGVYNQMQSLHNTIYPEILLFYDS
ncbi:hypothetical protein GJ496_000163 [Pomphorhynchus laevis]|nr:hypothetical protein GJ496_000163 [Pomphorhynchus laevis]